MSAIAIDEISNFHHEIRRDLLQEHEEVCEVD